MTFTIDLSGQTALITGGGHGVGRAIGHAFAAAGARVIVNDYLPERAEEVAAELIAAGGSAEPCPFDVSDYSAVRRSFASVSGGIDILINNAGNAGAAGFSVTLGSFAESEPADWDRYFAVNMYGAMYCTRAALPHMIERDGGRIVTIISEAARWGEARMAPYAAAKAAAGGFTRAIAREVGRHNITANNVALATVDTIGLAAMAQESPEFAARID
ncbi:MAG TPA: SDR family NAD(P)-dependent oxidoreductase, partial [Ilumatobacteraceae bacterium]